VPDATLTTKGQVTIPKAIRDHLRLDTGDRVSFVIHDDGTVVVQPVTRHVRDLAGLLHRTGSRAVSLRDMDEGIAKRMRTKFGRRR
jgi:antitoxin PrlF